MTPNRMPLLYALVASAVTFLWFQTAQANKGSGRAEICQTAGAFTLCAEAGAKIKVEKMGKDNVYFTVDGVMSHCQKLSDATYCE